MCGKKERWTSELIQEYLTIPHNGKPDSQAVYASIACEYIINALKKL